MGVFCYLAENPVSDSTPTADAFIAEVDELCGVTGTKERVVYDHAVPLPLCLQRLHTRKIIVKNPVISVQIGLIALSFFID